MIAAWRRRYGSTPLHLLLHVALLCAVAWVALQVADAREPANILMWFVLAVVLHDLALVPLYSALDRVARRAVPRGAINHVRVPVLLSALLFALFFPPILGRNDGSFARVAGVEPTGYLERWLVLSAVLFAASAVLYALRGRRAALD